MSKQSYWEKRKVQDMFHYMEQAEKKAEELAKLYLKASRYLSLESEGIFEKYKTKHGLSDSEARRLLNTLQDKTSLEQLKEALRSGKSDKTKEEILALLESPAYQARLERLKQLQNQLDLVMQQVYQQEKTVTTSHYVDMANDAYYRSIFRVQQQTGLAFSFNLIDPKVIDRIIDSQWSGANYSKRIWSNTSALAKDLKEELLFNLITDRTERETAEIIANKFAVGASKARRLVRTESCFVSSQMDMEGYGECGIERYRFLATLDLVTSDICRSLDGKVFLVSEQMPGTNCPPMHPWCRSTTMAVFDDENLGDMRRRAREPETGKTYLVPADMTYEQWYKSKVKGHPEAELNEKMIKNRVSDKKQYGRYKKILGSDAPDSLDSFQNMKYTDSENVWRFVKLDYSRRSKLMKNPELRLPNAENATAADAKFTRYLFGGEHPEGLAKGKAFSSRLGYSVDNWQELQKEIIQRASFYPAHYLDNNGYGDRYEQKIVLYGSKEKPANVIVGWFCKSDGSTSLSSAYIKEVE